MNRPFFNYRIADLEAELARRKGEGGFLRELIYELGFRSTPRAGRLKAQAIEALRIIQKSPPPSQAIRIPSNHGGAPRTPVENPPPLAPVANVESGTPAVTLQRPPVPRMTNTPDAILDAWTALEVLSPPAFPRPEALAGGDRGAVAWLDRDRLPWEGNGEKARPNTRLFYQIVLGTIDLEKATAQLLARYSDSRLERPTVRGEAVLAVVIVDRAGRRVEAPGVFVSSFGWGVPHALRGDLAALAEWRSAEKPLVEGLNEIFERTSDDGEVLPVDRATITAGWEWLVRSLCLPRELVGLPRFAIRSFPSYRSSEPPEPLLLNSFFLNDLGAAKTLFSEGRATPTLRRYLGCEIPPERRDLLHDTEALEAAVAPEATPPARWPGPGRHSLVLLQQAAVNLAFRELRDAGILAVNGPPGTGKTTLLRDLVAGIVTARAEVMTGFDDPTTAFIHSGETLKVGQTWLHLYHLDPKLQGFEMLVACSTNKAAENVSAELPGLKAIAADAEDLRYFSTLSDALQEEKKTWGLIAAVLGNAANRGQFKTTFWWDDDAGLSTYLAEAAGTPQVKEVIDPTTGARETRSPRIVFQEKPPRSQEDALRRWKQARKAFGVALEKSRKGLEELARVRTMAASLPSLAQEEAAATRAVVSAREAETEARAAAETARLRQAETKGILEDSVLKLKAHDDVAPGFLARIFRTRRAREWKVARMQLVESREQAQESHSQASRSLSASEERLRQAMTQRQAAEHHFSSIAARHAEARRFVELARENLGIGFIDADFFSREHAERHKTAPWISAELQRIRDDVFVAAMKLHRAFIDAAAKPLRHNLGCFMKVLGGGTFPTREKQALVPDLWASLFLVVPLISTTFASVERMLGRLPPATLGWLFVDEAGQALPQAAVGALMRSRRTVIVGDPMQIEPIVVLPETLTYAICRHFGADPDRFNAPNASVQTLADAATPYLAEFHTKEGSRTVGVPLLVHRRCAEPMFGISNAVAYAYQMVHAKSTEHSRIGEVLGPSAWIDVCGSAEEKWCPEEGEAVLALLRRLAEKNVTPDLYIVTPFVIVAANLRRLVRECGDLSEWISDQESWTSERIGTVHTVQGREAEAVIFVLGAPAAYQAGARGWAGGRPNLLNVAVTRAKERLYVIGNRSLWREAGRFRELDSRL